MGHCHLTPLPDPPYRIAFAPMMGYTDAFLRAWARMTYPALELYTEMIPAAALATDQPAVHDRFLRGWREGVQVQLGGSDPAVLAAACRTVARSGYTGINLNVGCPSARVQAGAFGACLMKVPGQVAHLWRVMQEAVAIPVGIKARIGVDDCQSWDFLHDFVGQLYQAGCRHLVLHARRALLHLDPRSNRRIPPLEYDKVYAIKQAYPALRVDINGGIQTVEAIAAHMAHVDGVMIGRALLNNMAWIQPCFAPVPPSDLGSKVSVYIQAARHWASQMASGSTGVPMAAKRPILLAVHGVPGAKQCRNQIQQIQDWAAFAACLYAYQEQGVIA